jgi:hypothetical protein
MSGAKRHGQIKVDKSIAIRFGIRNVFSNRSLISLQIDKSPFGKVSQYSDHFEKILNERIFYSLVCFEQSCDSFSKTAIINPQGKFIFNKDAHLYYRSLCCISLESFYSYWNILIDDIAKLILFFFDAIERQKINVDDFNFYKLIGLIRNGKFGDLKFLFSEIENPNSWWALNFKRGSGIRQRIIHFPNRVSIDGNPGINGLKASPSIWDFSEDGIKITENLDQMIFKTLKEFLIWLDKLEEVLLNRNRDIAQKHGATLNQTDACYTIVMHGITQELCVLPKIE